MFNVQQSPATTMATTIQIKKTERREVRTCKGLQALVERHNLSPNALDDTLDGCQILNSKVRAVISHYARDNRGGILCRWHDLNHSLQSTMITELSVGASWLRQFEGDWAAIFMLKKCVNQRISEQQRRQRRKAATGRNAVAPSPGKAMTVIVFILVSLIFIVAAQPLPVAARPPPVAAQSSPSAVPERQPISRGAGRQRSARAAANDDWERENVARRAARREREEELAATKSVEAEARTRLSRRLRENETSDNE